MDSGPTRGPLLPARRPLKGGELVVDYADERDASEVLDLFRSVLAEGRYFISHPDEYPDSVVWQADVIRDLQGIENCCFLVGRLAGERRIAGVVTLQGGRLRRMRHTAKLELFVGRSWRGRGLGRAMMEVAIAWATNHPTVTKLGLSVFEDNTAAVGLYRALGFQVEGNRVGEYRDDDGTLRNDLLMWLAV